MKWTFDVYSTNIWLHLFLIKSRRIFFTYVIGSLSQCVFAGALNEPDLYIVYFFIMVHC